MKFSNINYNIDSKDKNQPLDNTSFELSVKNAPSKFTKYIIEDSYNNRKEILKVAKNSAGVYIFLTSNGGLYVGSSVELYARVVSYFKPSSVSNADRHVLHHLNQGYPDRSVGSKVCNFVACHLNQGKNTGSII
jgi:hypothetical protein